MEPSFREKPHVTELLELLNKPALLKWANGLGLKGVTLESYQSEALKKGNDIHNQINEYHKYGIPFSDKLLEVNYQKFLQDKEFVDSEQKVECEFFTGRYDIKLKINGEFVIGDFKSSNRIYFDNILQLTAYRMCISNCSVAIIGIPEFTYKPLNKIDFEPYENILKALAIIWKNKRLVE